MNNSLNLLNSNTSTTNYENFYGNVSLFLSLQKTEDNEENEVP